jgi:hypothetical protein
MVIATDVTRRGADWRDVLVALLRELGRLQRQRVAVAALTAAVPASGGGP